nr:PREDICTED: transcription factor E2F5 isoform X1 [Lepisosteus oculatus]
MAESVFSSPQTRSPSGSYRSEKGLSLLTTKFVSLMQEAKDGVLDLKVAADSLAEWQKRRIYDITNVLEGIGLIEKKTKNSIQWKGVNTRCNTKEITDRVQFLKAQIEELEMKEKELDTQRTLLQQNTKRILDDPMINRFAYVTHDDICNAFGGDTLLAVIAPSGTQLDVPVPEPGQNGQKKYQVNLKSQTAPIQVMLLNKPSSSSKPVVLSVPPPDDLCVVPSPPTTPASLEKCHSFIPEHAVPLQEQYMTSAVDLQIDCTVRSGPCLTMPVSLTATGSETESNDDIQQINADDLQTLLPLDVGSMLNMSTVDQSKEETEESTVGDVLQEIMSTEVLPLLQLSPNPELGYSFNLNDNEGLVDLFDVRILNY